MASCPNGQKAGRWVTLGEAIRGAGTMRVQQIARKKRVVVASVYLCRCGVYHASHHAGAALARRNGIIVAKPGGAKREHLAKAIADAEMFR